MQVKYDEAMNVKLLLREICQFLDTGRETGYTETGREQLKNLASKVLFALSVNNFSAVFSRISGRLQELSVSNEETSDYTDIELIQHINIDIARLTKLFSEAIAKFRTLKKNAHLVLMQSLEKAVWTWMDTYPHEFTDLQKNTNEELTKCCDTFFDLLDNFAEAKTKHRHVIWPLQIMLLILTPKVLEEINNADSGAPCSPRHLKKKHFIDAIKKSLQSHKSSEKALVEAGAITCVKLCKAATYINVLDSNNVIFNVVQTVINDLKNLLFKVEKPFARGSQFLKEDIDLMIDCFLANFRINPHNNDTLKVCLNTNSPHIYHHVLVSALYRIITQPRLPWWPQIDMLYNKSAELRSMFAESWNRVAQNYSQGQGHQPAKMMPSIDFKPKVTVKFSNRATSEEAGFQKSLLLCMVRLIHADPMLFLNSQGKSGHEIQPLTLELINGLVSLVHHPGMPDVSSEAMDALSKLHQPEKIELWNPENPISTFWDISSQVLFSMSQKLIQHQILNYTEVLKWMRDILVCRNQFLLRHRDYANVGSQIAICRQAHIKLEVVYFMYLWSIDMEAVLVAMSCFSLLCEEADIRGGSDEVTATFLLPNYAVYQVQIVVN